MTASSQLDLPGLKRQQLEIATRAVIQGSLEDVQRFVALDMSNKARSNDPLFAAAVVFEVGNLKPLEVKTAFLEDVFPYIPGFLSFREAPVLMAAMAKLETGFDLLWVDGFGRLHPRRAGIATHLGVTLEKPALGVAKTPFVGRVAPLEDAAGSVADVVLDGETLGYAVRSRLKSKPIFVSSGHECSLESALAFVRSHLDGLRLPYPSRAAHLAANAARLEWERERGSSEKMGAIRENDRL
jgi:deoxyribonuclease V